jgi:cyanophycinase
VKRVCTPLPALRYALLTLLLLPCSNAFAKQPSPAGTLIIIGGALRFDNAEVWSRVVKSAAEAQTQPVSTDAATAYRPKIAVFPTASGDPERAGRITCEALENYGADPFVVPLALTKLEMDPLAAVKDPVLVEQVRNADGIYFTGGNQARITKALRAEDGSDTPMLEAVWDVYRRGGVVAGTSAGAAIMSRIMYRDAKKVLPTMQNGVTMGKEVDQGLGFLDHSWFVEQHTLVRGRFARALVAMKANDIKFGVGVDENTAIVVKNDHMEVVGHTGVIVMDISDAVGDPEVKGFNVKNVRLTYLDHGDKMQLSTREVVPSEKKQSGDKLDPQAADFSPEDDDKLFTNDILGNTVAVDLMQKMMKNRNSEALGLAFDGSAVQQGPTQGFEFRFYRAEDTIGWCCSTRGDECYTVRNIHLDIRPIELTGPLYK